MVDSWVHTRALSKDLFNKRFFENKSLAPCLLEREWGGGHGTWCLLVLRGDISSIPGPQSRGFSVAERAWGWAGSGGEGQQVPAETRASRD